MFKPVSQSKKTSKSEGVNVQCIQNQLKGQRGVQHYGLVTMTTTTPVSEAGAKAEKKMNKKRQTKIWHVTNKNISDRKQPKRHVKEIRWEKINKNTKGSDRKTA